MVSFGAGSASDFFHNGLEDSLGGTENQSPLNDQDQQTQEEEEGGHKAGQAQHGGDLGGLQFPFLSL